MNNEKSINKKPITIAEVTRVELLAIYSTPYSN
jgi:hypothetical protein